jgi:hypothetical protein
VAFENRQPPDPGRECHAVARPVQRSSTRLVHRRTARLDLAQALRKITSRLWPAVAQILRPICNGNRMQMQRPKMAGNGAPAASRSNVRRRRYVIRPGSGQAFPHLVAEGRPRR